VFAAAAPAAANLIVVFLKFQQCSVPPLLIWLQLFKLQTTVTVTPSCFTSKKRPDVNFLQTLRPLLKAR
jgi:hypothetical protein